MAALDRIADQARQLAWVVDTLNVPVMAYGLKNNVYGTLFSEAVATIMALADDFQEIKQLCHCGRKATMILKYDRNGEAVRSGEVVEIGGEGRYISVCRPHWTAGDIGPAARALVEHLGISVHRSRGPRRRVAAASVPSTTPAPARKIGRSEPAGADRAHPVPRL